MDHLEISQKGTEFHIEGFPDAEKVIRIHGPLAKRLSDLKLHMSDLDFADACLDAINLAPEEPHIIREALWRSAIVHFFKCFGNSAARFQFAPAKVFGKEPPEAMIAFDYFKGLRNKHLVHDENSFTQSLPGAILNKREKAYKIEKIVCLSMTAATLMQENFSNLKLLIEKTRTWAVAEFDSLCAKITSELEKESYDSLYARETIFYRAPTNDELHTNRNAL